MDYAKVIFDICFDSKESFQKQHEKFKQLGIRYINFNETEQTTLLGKIKADIVQHDSRALSDSENYYIKDKIHTNIQKFSPENVNEEGFDILVNFIRDCFKY
jgi:hypothetical protein